MKVDPEQWPTADLRPLPATVVEDPPEPQLFDLAADPGETTDLAQVHPARVSAMVTELERWFADVDGERRSLTWDT